MIYYDAFCVKVCFCVSKLYWYIYCPMELHPFDYGFHR